MFRYVKYDILFGFKIYMILLCVISKRINAVYILYSFDFRDNITSVTNITWLPFMTNIQDFLCKHNNPIMTYIIRYNILTHIVLSILPFPNNISYNNLYFYIGITVKICNF